MSEPQNQTAPSAPAPARTGSAAFVTHFMPGLIIGLLVGGLAGAFLPVLLERDGIPSTGTNSSGSVTPAPRDPQDPRTVQPTPEPAPTETTPEQAPTTPPPPAEPVTTPAKPK